MWSKVESKIDQSPKQSQQQLATKSKNLLLLVKKKSFSNQESAAKPTDQSNCNVH